MRLAILIALLLASSVQAVEVVSTSDDWVSRGRGAAVGPDLVITAGHVIETNSETTVDGLPATVERIDHARDLAALRVEGARLEWREIGPEPPIGSTVFVETGRGRIPAVVSTDGLVTSQETSKGDSGSAVIDNQGRVVGIHVSRGGKVLKPAWLGARK